MRNRQPLPVKNGALTHQRQIDAEEWVALLEMKP